MRQKLLALLVVALCCAAASLRADTLDGVLEVQSAFVNVNAGVYQLHARIRYPGTDEIRGALRDGVSLGFVLDVVVARERRYWFNSELLNLSLRRELSYHVVSDRYVVRDARSSEQQTYGTLESALEGLGSIDAWPILTAPQLRGAGEYRISVRAGMRRGALTDALRMLMFWSNDWHRESEWYTWSLPR